MASAVIVIDVQQALCAGAEETWQAADVIKRINVVTQSAREKGVPVIFVQHEEAEGEFVYQSAGWQLADGLISHTNEPIVRKTTPNSFHLTHLQSLLKEKGIDHLIICGMQTDFCVDTTVRQALAYGYPVSLVSDGHTTVDNGVLTADQIIRHHNKNLSSFGSFGVRTTLVKHDEVFAS
ncbi:cysteine hydrolase [Leeia sp. TBRC 13508]|uniref:Cysteine hydrolase n=1 Tax=Leeia speluncae TaxID=2884804 RepID=A0ABS8D937_9NEIS|nr:cysteine hydrolase family protein [Leeia speluncae]MCB6184632.1 cysteine hydrolase [Leeia speluncae]